ncbi:hypothetical protein, partial [Promicromonospora sp. NPDC059942]|uniref:hypothetical protein n=1 Tax=Promicromonospora sp. NPDC059942 TaxID=3347009 RepID=UPI00365C301E
MVLTDDARPGLVAGTGAVPATPAANPATPADTPADRAALREPGSGPTAARGLRIPGLDGLRA